MVQIVLGCFDHVPIFGDYRPFLARREARPQMPHGAMSYRGTRQANCRQRNKFKLMHAPTLATIFSAVDLRHFF
jgi:hypothetical protein